MRLAMRGAFLGAVLAAGCSTTASPAPLVPEERDPGTGPEEPRRVSRLELRRYETPMEEEPLDAALRNLLYETARDLGPREDQEIVVESHGAPVALADCRTLDIEWGNGHAQTLDLLRIRFEGGEALLEQVGWEGSMGVLARSPEEGRDRPSLRRATVPSEAVRWTRDLCRVLPMVACSSRSTVTASGGSSWSTSADFYVLVRILDSAGRALACREYCGYQGSGDELLYAPIERVVEQARKEVARIDTWQEVPVGEWRSSHLGDALAWDREILLEDFHWWVAESFVEMASWFADEGARESLLFLRERRPDLSPRLTEKIERSLLRLAGPPRGLED